jgi:DNA-directed RNA polymerase subunit K/omega
MRQAPVDLLLVRISPKFAMVNAVAARAKQLINGDIPTIETTTRNPVLVSMEELALGKFHVVHTGLTGHQRAGVAGITPSTEPQTAESAHPAHGLSAFPRTGALVVI